MTVVLSLMLSGLLSGCVAPDGAAPQASDEVVSFVAQADTQVAAPLEAQVVTGVTLVIPPGLRVSEANSYYPLADIVWRGDPPGDRREQIRSIFADAVAAAALDAGSGRPVRAEITLRRFHSLTEKTRYTVGGVHSIKFDLTVRDAATGAVIDGPRRINADVPASGGGRALAEDRAGRTQRVVIVEGLARVLRRELGPGGEAPVSSRAAVSPAVMPVAVPRF